MWLGRKVCGPSTPVPLTVTGFGNRIHLSDNRLVPIGSAPAIVFFRPAQRSLKLWPARSPSRLATLYIESSDSFVASAAASIATGWSEPVPGREFHTEVQRPFTAHRYVNLPYLMTAKSRRRIHMSSADRFIESRSLMRSMVTSAGGYAAIIAGSCAKLPWRTNTVVTRSPQAFFTAVKMRSLSSIRTYSVRQDSGAAHHPVRLLCGCK